MHYQKCNQFEYSYIINKTISSKFPSHFIYYDDSAQKMIKDFFLALFLLLQQLSSTRCTGCTIFELWKVQFILNFTSFNMKWCYYQLHLNSPRGYIFLVDFYKRKELILMLCSVGLRRIPPELKIGIWNIGCLFQYGWSVSPQNGDQVSTWKIVALWLRRIPPEQRSDIWTLGACCT